MLKTAGMSSSQAGKTRISERFNKGTFRRKMWSIYWYSILYDLISLIGDDRSNERLHNPSANTAMIRSVFWVTYFLSVYVLISVRGEKIGNQPDYSMRYENYNNDN